MVARNKLRYFYPDEWEKYTSVIINPDHEFWSEFYLNTGVRVGEGRALKISQIDFEKKYFDLLKTKGNNPRPVCISSRFNARLNKYILLHRLKPSDTLQIPSRQFLDKMIKKYTKKAGLRNPDDFGCHSFRKTHENWLCALGVNSMIITAQMGHSINVAQQYYVSQTKFNQQEKMRIRSLLDDLFMVDNSPTFVNQTQQNYTQLTTNELFNRPNNTNLVDNKIKMQLPNETNN